ncbi:MAG: hypothetical protein HKL96_06255 [Phycisphaerales bacterium]|nr:hypothetical protein [Phycisphaerales bacterium]
MTQLCRVGSPDIKVTAICFDSRGIVGTWNAQQAKHNASAMAVTLFGAEHAAMRKTFHKIAE